MTLHHMVFLVNLLSCFSILSSSDIDLPTSHLQYYFNNFPGELEICSSDDTCEFQDIKISNQCWGYEDHCNKTSAYSEPECPGSHQGWVKNKQEQINTFYKQADFGYVKEQMSSMKVMCEPLFKDDSALVCTDHLQFCRGRNIKMNFTSLKDRKDPFRYKMDVLGEGDVGGYCRFHRDRLHEQADHVSPLQSWAPELRYFKELSKRPIEEEECDVVLHKPTYIMKIDATVNMYHHMCDFVNLYISLHLNSTHPTMFNKDVQILLWETYPYYSKFADLFTPFTSNEILTLRNFSGKVVCFKNVVLPLLPRMIFGLFYNTPLIYGCEKSGLFHAFSEFILHRLNIPLHKRLNSKVRITILSRETKFRNILNEEELLEALKMNSSYDVRRVVYNKEMSFVEQLEVTRNTDIFIGMHGAGLTHLLFLPDWAAVFEIYHCQDSNCFLDLARLRGVKYATWKNQDKLVQQDEGHHPDGGSHAKFTNYAFDKDEFLEIVNELAEHVLNHSQFNAFISTINKIEHTEL